MNLFYNHKCDVLNELKRRLANTPLLHHDSKRRALKNAIEIQQLEMDTYLKECLAMACFSHEEVHFSVSLDNFIATRDGEEFTSADVIAHVQGFHPDENSQTIRVAFYERIGFTVEKLDYNRYRAIHQNDSSK